MVIKIVVECKNMKYVFILEKTSMYI